MNYPSENFSETLSPDLRAKYEKLREILASYKTAICAFSGGVDSTLLAVVANNVLGDHFTALTIISEFNQTELSPVAESLAKRYNFRHVFLRLAMLKDETIVSNPIDRCYHCKKKILTAIHDYAQEHNIPHIIEGQNIDDAKGYRPGRRAVQETGTHSPLAEAGLNKAEIRILSKAIGIPTWNMPSAPCIATRFPYNVRLELENLRRVADAETFIKSFGVPDCRVRMIGKIAIIEANPKDMKLIYDIHETITSKLKSLGFERVTLDLEGYRAGSFDAGLSDSEKRDTAKGTD